MKIAGAISYFFAVTNVARSYFYREVYIDQAIQDILQSIGRQDIIIRIQRYDIYDGAQRLLDVVARNVATTWPSQILGGRIGFGFQPGDLASSRTLLIYIYASNDDVNDAELLAMLNDTNLISHPKHRPKLLLIIGSNTGTLDGRRQLKYLWDRRLFDVIILEVSFHPQYSEPIFVAVHRFNGFNGDYSRVTVYEDETNWYPNKLRDMHGGTFKVMFKEVRPYGTLENGTVGGLAKLFMNALSDAVNGTVVHTSDLQESDMRYNAEGLVYENEYSTQYEHTVAIGDDRICALVPTMPAARVLVDFWRIIITILLGFLLAAVVWCASLIMSISERVRDPLNTISLILGMAPLHGPRSPVEKVLFVAVVMTVAEYTIIFQAELLEFVVEFAVSTRVSTFQDLYKTGLKVVVSPVVYDELATTEGLSPEFMKRFISSAEFAIQDKDGTVDTSKAYFTTEIDGKLAETNNKLKRKGRRLFKLSDLCILSHYRVHNLNVRSPFKTEVDNVLLSLVESGFSGKYVDDFWKDDKSGRKHENGMTLRDHSVYVAFFVIIVGHSVSFIVFLGEVIADRVLKRKRFSLSFSYCKSTKVSKQSKINTKNTK
ncbi:PREDICTED: uncharacterized protein LOC105568180 [Vollenhovia emeryi]|uniref:uncharacterized protein LOC105568180 n=1 Tax=Vollenhovia emeryi TaxID=411798 RepID=UPI0005F55D8A|nr:PREDICTED: uncharacterized protein LOC105568180 [Vollenhovia emeryi]